MAVEAVHSSDVADSYADGERIGFGVLLLGFGYVGIKLLRTPNYALTQVGPV